MVGHRILNICVFLVFCCIFAVVLYYHGYSYHKGVILFITCKQKGSLERYETFLAYVFLQGNN